MPRTKPKSNFDIDLDFGGANEEKIRKLFEGDGSIEVKTERDTWVTTGNIAIEIKYKGNPSGLSTTKAKWWIHVLSYNNKTEFSFIFPVSVLRRKVKWLHMEKRAIMTTGGDDNNSTLILCPLKELVKSHL